jgi:hypothetical protein
MTKPSGPEWAIEATAQITPSLRVHMTAGPAGFTMEWEPAMPRSLTPGQVNRYRKARDKLIAQVAKRMGSGVAVIGI